MEIREVQDEDREWIRDRIAERWGSEVVITRGRVHHPVELPGLVATAGNERRGLLTYRREGKHFEIVTLDAFDQGKGVGTALVERMVRIAQDAGATKLWLVTTNDNMRALAFYQKRGFSIVAVHANALEKSRERKPEIPLVGMDGIPLRDEIELHSLRFMASPGNEDCGEKS